MKYRASTNQLGCVGWVHPKPLPTEYGSLMGFQWVSLLATVATPISLMGPLLRIINYEGPLLLNYFVVTKFLRLGRLDYEVIEYLVNL